MMQLEDSCVTGVKPFIILNYNDLLNNYYVADTTLIIGDAKRKRFLPLGSQPACWICYETILSN